MDKGTSRKTTGTGTISGGTGLRIRGQKDGPGSPGLDRSGIGEPSLALRVRQHRSEWKDCQRCHLGSLALRHCLWSLIPKEAWSFFPGKETGQGPVEGSGEGGTGVTAHVVFVGEGPGSVEDTTGLPFTGQSGKLLRAALGEAGLRELGVRVVLANLLACRPQELENGRMVNRAPAPDEVEACKPRLEEVFSIFRPKVIVAVGRVPESYLLGETPPGVEFRQIIHPSALLRRGIRSTERCPEYVESIRSILRSSIPS